MPLAVTTMLNGSAVLEQMISLQRKSGSMSCGRVTPKRLAGDNYIGQSGGVTRKADKKHIYVVHANGSVIANSSSRWYNLGASAKIETGDTIVVPLDTERLPTLPFWQAVTQIIYNVAIAAAAVNSF